MVSVNESMIGQIRALLAQRPLWMPVPGELRSAFRAWRWRDLPRYIRVSSLPLLALVYALAVSGSVELNGRLSPHDEALWTGGVLYVCGLLTVALALAQWGPAQRHYPWLAMPFSVIILAKFVAMPQLMTHPAAIMSESLFCMITITIVVLGLRLTLLQGALVSLMALIAGGVIIRLLGPEGMGNWHTFVYYFGSMTGFCLFIAWIMEEEEKVSFLQSVVIDHAARDREKLIRELDGLAYQDSLSGLANRREFDRSLSAEWDRMHREQKPLAALYVDIDHFKAYNDRYGHAAGDACLAAVAGAIGQALRRPGDLAARYGGEEFVVLLPDTDLSGAEDVAHRLLAAVTALAMPHADSATAEVVTVSVGVASARPQPSWRQEELLEMADRALYQAKTSGRHRVCISTASPRPPVLPRRARAETD